MAKTSTEFTNAAGDDVLYITPRKYRQPKEELARVERRSLFNKLAVGCVAAATIALGGLAYSFIPDSPKPPQNDQIYQPEPRNEGKSEGLALITLLGALSVAVAGGAVTGSVALRNARALPRLRQDVVDGMIVNNKGKLIHPAHYDPQTDDVIDFSKPRPEAAPR